MSFQLGMDAVLNYTPDDGVTWVPIPSVKDVTLNMEASEADVSIRGGGGWRATAAALRDASIEFNMLWDPADAGFAQIRDAFLASDTVGLQVLDAAAGEGLQGSFAITGFSREEPLDDALGVSVTAKLSQGGTATQWMP